MCKMFLNVLDIFLYDKILFISVVIEFYYIYFFKLFNL